MHICHFLTGDRPWQDNGVPLYSYWKIRRYKETQTSQNWWAYKRNSQRLVRFLTPLFSDQFPARSSQKSPRFASVIFFESQRVFAGHQSILDKVYQLASSSSPYSEMIVRARTVDALAVELRTLLERAALKGDFTDVLSQHRTFQVWVYSHFPAVCWWQIASI